MDSWQQHAIHEDKPIMACCIWTWTYIWSQTLQSECHAFYRTTWKHCWRDRESASSQVTLLERTISFLKLQPSPTLPRESSRFCFSKHCLWLFQTIYCMGPLSSSPLTSNKQWLLLPLFDLVIVSLLPAHIRGWSSVSSIRSDSDL